MKALNDSRKEMTEKGVEKAIEQIETTDLKKIGYWLEHPAFVMKVLRELLPEDSKKNITGPYLF